MLCFLESYTFHIFFSNACITAMSNNRINQKGKIQGFTFTLFALLNYFQMLMCYSTSRHRQAVLSYQVQKQSQQGNPMYGKSERKGGF